MKKRIDVLLVDMGFFPSREQARRTIMAGNVFVDNQRVDKPGTMIKDGSDILVKGKLVHQDISVTMPNKFIRYSKYIQFSIKIIF